MLDCVISVVNETRSALNAAIPGTATPLYVGLQRPATATLPHAWLRESNEGPFEPNLRRVEDIVYLDLYARSSGELQKMENAVSFLDDHNPTGYGNAAGITYLIQSKTRLAEAEGAVHTTILFSVRYFDKRKLIA